MNEDIVTMISREATSKIICHKYMEEYFLKNGYVSAKKIHINLLYKLFSLKVLRKIRTFFKLLLRCKFYFRDSENSEFVIFDSEHTQCLEEILTNRNYTIVSTRIEQIKEIYATPKIIFYIINNIFKRSLKQNYLTALIKTIAPKIVITQISDSEDFHIISKLLQNEIKFMAIQTYSPSMYEYMFTEKSKKNFFIPKLFCFSEYDEQFYKKKKVNIESFEVIGSIQSSLCCEYIKSENIEINSNKYDICLISEAVADLSGDLFFHIKNLDDFYGQVAEFTYRLCKKHNLNIIISGRGAKNEEGKDLEAYFYKHFLKNYDFEINSSPDKRKKKYQTYINMMQSKLVIALGSTALREAISFEKKILAFNPNNHSYIKFPGPDIDFLDESLCTLNKPSYELFEKRVLKLLSMTNEEYFSQLGKEKSFIMKPTTNAANIVRKRLNEIVK